MFVSVGYLVTEISQKGGLRSALCKSCVELYGVAMFVSFGSLVTETPQKRGLWSAMMDSYVGGFVRG